MNKPPACEELSHITCITGQVSQVLPSLASGNSWAAYVTCGVDFKGWHNSQDISWPDVINIFVLKCRCVHQKERETETERDRETSFLFFLSSFPLCPFCSLCEAVKLLELRKGAGPLTSWVKLLWLRWKMFRGRSRALRANGLKVSLAHLLPCKDRVFVRAVKQLAFFI